jgi:hypothetical protein
MKQKEQDDFHSKINNSSDLIEIFPELCQYLNKFASMNCLVCCSECCRWEWSVHW